MKHVKKKMGKLERKALDNLIRRRLSMARNSITMAQSDLHQISKIIGDNVYIQQFTNLLENSKTELALFENNGQWEKYLDFQLSESKNHE